MKLYKLFSYAIFLIATNIAYTQSTYNIDYSYETLNANCNVFQTSLLIDNFNHQSTIGFPTFTGATSYYVNLQCKRNSSSSQVGTEYQIIFPFKQGYKYQINIQSKGTVASSSELYPMVGVKINEFTKTHNTSTSCSGPQAVNASNYDATVAVGPSLAWNLQPIINMSSPLTKNYQSLSIAAIPWIGSSATGTQSVQIRAIQIVETAVNPPVYPVAVVGTSSLDGSNIFICRNKGTQTLTCINSYDPDGTIVSYKWSSSTLTFASSTSSTTIVSPMSGSWTSPFIAFRNFSLELTDNQGNITIANYQLVTGICP